MNCRVRDITKGLERVAISLFDDVGTEELPKFGYIPRNIVHEDAHIDLSLARISDKDCCKNCEGDCLSSKLPCPCASETSGGEYAYTSSGLLKEEFLDTCLKMRQDPDSFKKTFCIDCPLEKNGLCDGHLIQKFIKECWTKCGCDMLCGNRIVQRGIKYDFQVFPTHEGKGWGVRTLQDLPKGTFVCEYVGEILTNNELDKRNKNCYRVEKHTYPVTLDADWVSERDLKDKEALCLDATFFGNVARFINHRCEDANLIDIPVQIETPDRHYYHIAFFTTRDVKAMDELTWDYMIDFSDEKHPVKAFRCCCGSELCRDKTKKGDKVGVWKRGTRQKAVKKQDNVVPAEPSMNNNNAGVQEAVSSNTRSLRPRENGRASKIDLKENGTSTSNGPVQKKIVIQSGEKRKRKHWTEAEVKMLKDGVEKFRNNRNIPWIKILQHGGSAFQEGRQPSELKDKWKNLNKQPA